MNIFEFEIIWISSMRLEKTNFLKELAKEITFLAKLENFYIDVS